MSILTINADLGAVVSVLSRIADALDRLSPPIQDYQLALKKRDASAIVRYGDEDRQWLRENFTNLIHEVGLAPAEEETLVQKMLSQYEGETDEPGQKE